MIVKKCLHPSMHIGYAFSKIGFVKNTIGNLLAQGNGKGRGRGRGKACQRAGAPAALRDLSACIASSALGLGAGFAPPWHLTLGPALGLG